MTERDRSDDGHDTSTRTTALEYEIDDDESPSIAVVRAVSTATETPVLDLDPLYHSIDPEYLDGLFDEGKNGIDSVDVHVGGCRLTVTRDTVRVRPLTDRSGDTSG